MTSRENDLLRSISREVAEETQWMAMAFEGKSAMDRQMVTKALLDRWNTSGKYLVELKGYKLTSQDLSIFCCERYLNDEVMNLLIVKYCDEANVRLGRDFFTLLPSYATSKFCTSAVNHVCFNVDMSTVEIIFLPVHIHGCHWGLSIFDVNNRDVRFDDGYHCSITKEMQDKTRTIITSFYQATGLPCFEMSLWSPVQRFKVPMPDQPSVSATSCNGTGSCGVGVVYCVKDICNGFTENFTWTFDNAPQLRAQLMVDLLKK